MHFYRPLTPIKAITFDLDDTLYDNSRCIQRAQEMLLAYLRTIPQLKDLQLAEFNAVRQQVLQNDPEIYHDVIVWRKTAIAQLLQQVGVATEQIMSLTERAMYEFTEWRHQLTVPSASLQILEQLKQRYPLAVITNGNVEIARIGLDGYFQFALRGGEHGRSKPFTEIFLRAAKQLQLPPHQILHVGDNLQADVAGAIASGMQACWLNLEQQDILQLPNARLLPTVEITDLAELLQLL